MQFTVYAEDIVETIDRLTINHHLYADDSQLLTHMRLMAVTEHRRRLDACVMILRNLVFFMAVSVKSRQNRTDLVWLHGLYTEAHQLDVVNLNHCSVIVEPVDTVRDLGVILDSELSMREHISNISSTCFSTFAVYESFVH